jgi:hypothetical protein
MEFILNDGSITYYSDGFRVGSIATPVCDPCHEMESGVSMITCTAEGWSGTQSGEN